MTVVTGEAPGGTPVPHMFLTNVVIKVTFHR